VENALDTGFEDIIALARSRLNAPKIEQDIDEDRAILTVDGEFGKHRVFVKEVVDAKARRYAYYMLIGDRVVIGLDNHADRTALRLRYGEHFAAHIHELIPHRHGTDKRDTVLTEAWTAVRFLTELDELIKD
jgi:hypothetical protein